jgi:hypothetical protein
MYAVLTRLWLGDERELDPEACAIGGHQTDQARVVVIDIRAEGPSPESCDAERIVRIEAERKVSRFFEIGNGHDTTTSSAVLWPVDGRVRRW